MTTSLPCPSRRPKSTKQAEWPRSFPPMGPRDSRRSRKSHQIAIGEKGHRNWLLSDSYGLFGQLWGMLKPNAGIWEFFRAHCVADGLVGPEAISFLYAFRHRRITTCMFLLCHTQVGGGRGTNPCPRG